MIQVYYLCISLTSYFNDCLQKYFSVGVLQLLAGKNYRQRLKTVGLLLVYLVSRVWRRCEQ